MPAMSAGLLSFRFIKEGQEMNKFIQYFAVAIFGITIPVYLMGAVVTGILLAYHFQIASDLNYIR